MDTFLAATLCIALAGFIARRAARNTDLNIVPKLAVKKIHRFDVDPARASTCQIWRKIFEAFFPIEDCKGAKLRTNQ